MGAEGQPPPGLGAVAPGQHLGDRRGQVVVADMHIRQAAGGLERRHVAFQERLLRLAGIDPVAGLPRARQAIGEHVAPGRLAGQAHGYVTEVDLGLGARVPGLRHEPPQALGAGAVLRGDLGAAAGHVLGHIRIRHLRAVLIAQTLEDPACGMPLLTRRGQVLAQHAVDQLADPVQHRRLPLRRLTARRDRRGDRLAHRPPVHVILAGQRPDRHLIALPVEADRREQLHSAWLHPGPTRSGGTPDIANDPPGHPSRPATARRVAARFRRGGAKSECYTTTATAPGWGQIKGEQWGHIRLLRPVEGAAGRSAGFQRNPWPM